MQFVPVFGSRELEGKAAKVELGLGVTREIYLLATNMKRGPANESIQVAVVGGKWGFGDKTDGTVTDCIQFAE